MSFSVQQPVLRPIELLTALRVRSGSERAAKRDAGYWLTIAWPECLVGDGA